MNTYIAIISNGIWGGILISFLVVSFSTNYNLNRFRIDYAVFIVLGAILPFSFMNVLGIDRSPYLLVFAGVLFALLLGVCSALLELFVYGPLEKKKAGMLEQMLASIGIYFASISIVGYFWGSSIIIETVNANSITVFNYEYSNWFIFTLVAYVGILSIMVSPKIKSEIHFFKAVAKNPELCETLGIKIINYKMFSSFLGGILAALVGILLLLESSFEVYSTIYIFLPGIAITLLSPGINPYKIVLFSMSYGIVGEFINIYMGQIWSELFIFVILALSIWKSSLFMNRYIIDD